MLSPECGWVDPHCGWDAVALGSDISQNTECGWDDPQCGWMQPHSGMGLWKSEFSKFRVRVADPQCGWVHPHSDSFLCETKLNHRRVRVELTRSAGGASAPEVFLTPFSSYLFLFPSSSFLFSSSCVWGRPKKEKERESPSSLQIARKLGKRTVRVRNRS